MSHRIVTSHFVHLGDFLFIYLMCRSFGFITRIPISRIPNNCEIILKKNNFDFRVIFGRKRGPNNGAIFFLTTSFGLFGLNNVVSVDLL